MGWNELGIMLLVAAVLCAVGFYKYVYFLSIGYGFAIAGLGIMIIVMFHDQMQMIHYLQCVLFVVYGTRLSGFLLWREMKNARYRKTLKEATGEESAVPFLVKIAIWVSVSILYVMQVSPVFYRQYTNAQDTIIPWIGVLISVLAICIESIADHQKSVQKAKNPNMVATKGLYKIVRCPNYLGEILFWTGVTIGGVTALHQMGQWIVVLVAYVSIIGIMFNGAQRLEKRQVGRYGNLPEYTKYADSTPILLPFVPIYHLYRRKNDET